MMHPLLSDPLFVLATAVALFLVALLLAVVVYREVRQRPALDVYAPYARQAVVAAFRLSEVSADEFGKRLAGTDKKKLAVALYDRLPVLHGRVTPAQWEPMVETAYTEMTALYERNKDALTAELEAQLGE